MRTSTKVFLILYFVTLVGTVLTSAFFFSSISITEQGLRLNLNTATYISLAFGIGNAIFGTILYVRFLKSQKLNAVLFFSVIPLTVTFATAVYFLATINNYQNNTVSLVKQVLQIDVNNSNNYLWIILLTVIYLIAVFIMFKVITKPLKKLEQAIERLSDGNVNDKILLGGGKQFQKIEHGLNKINDNYRRKDLVLKETNVEVDKYVPKQFVKYLGKNSLLELVVGTQVKKEVTTLFCDVRNSSQVSTSLSLEENFNYINSYLNVVSPIIKKYNGFIDKYLGDGVMAVFTRSRQAYDCAHAIIKAINEKNYSNVSMPNLEVGVALNTGEVVFGVVGDETRKSITILSESMEITSKIGEVNKVFGSMITFSKDTLNDLSSKISINYRYIGNIQNGKEFVSVFESLDAYPRIKKEKLIKNKVQFEQGVRAYINAKFDTAKKLFEEVYKKEKDDKVCYVFYNKCINKQL
ncbi:MAG: adenylate/guanylate cyclase domain-containing protein [Clostridiales bacterium]|nr:adenylate/guanylate cyclase domain-containing protein [Clostridiales bacterium]